MTNYSKQVTELNPIEGLLVETDFYKFFDEVGYIDNRIEAKIAYLSNRFWFVKGEDKIDGACIHLLTLIGSRYFHDKVAPKKS